MNKGLRRKQQLTFALILNGVGTIDLMNKGLVTGDSGQVPDYRV